jgi:hypothetical protein
MAVQSRPPAADTPNMSIPIPIQILALTLTATALACGGVLLLLISQRV